MSYNWNVYKIFNNGKRAKAPMHTFVYADEDKVKEYFDVVVKENFTEKIRRCDFELLRADLPQDRKAEVVDEEAKKRILQEVADSCSKYTVTVTLDEIPAESIIFEIVSCGFLDNL